MFAVAAMQTVIIGMGLAGGVHCLSDTPCTGERRSNAPLSDARICANSRRRVADRHDAERPEKSRATTSVLTIRHNRHTFPDDRWCGLPGREDNASTAPVTSAPASFMGRNVPEDHRSRAGAATAERRTWARP